MAENQACQTEVLAAFGPTGTRCTRERAAARRSFGTRRDDVRAQGTKPREEPKMNDIEAAAGDPRGGILRELHNALDSLETNLKRIPVSERVRPDPIDIIAQLRRQIIAQTTDRQSPS